MGIKNNLQKKILLGPYQKVLTKVFEEEYNLPL